MPASSKTRTKLEVVKRFNEKRELLLEVVEGEMFQPLIHGIPDSLALDGRQPIDLGALEPAGRGKRASDPQRQFCPDATISEICWHHREHVRILLEMALRAQPGQNANADKSASTVANMLAEGARTVLDDGKIKGACSSPCKDDCAGQRCSALLLILLEEAITAESPIWARFCEVVVNRSLCDCLLPLNFNSLKWDDLLGPVYRGNVFYTQWRYCPLKIKPDQRNEQRLIGFEQDTKRLPISEYSLIGEGYYGRVYKVKIVKGSFDNADPKYYAMKELTAKHGFREWENASMRVKNLHQGVHPNITSILACIVYSESKSLLLFDLAESDLWCFMETRKLHMLGDWEQKKQLFGEMVGLASALNSLRNIVIDGKRYGCLHLDLKPANILVFKNDKGYSFKLSDFGISKVLVQGSNAFEPHSHLRSSPSGDIPRANDADDCIPPESALPKALKLQSEQSCYSWDVWSYGAVLAQFMVWLAGGADYLLEFDRTRVTREASIASSTKFWCKLELLEESSNELKISEDPRRVCRLKDSVIETLTNLHCRREWAGRPEATNMCESVVEVLLMDIFICDPEKRTNIEKVMDHLSNIQADQYKFRGLRVLINYGRSSSVSSGRSSTPSLAGPAAASSRAGSMPPLLRPYTRRSHEPSGGAIHEASATSRDTSISFRPDEKQASPKPIVLKQFDDIRETSDHNQPQGPTISKGKFQALKRNVLSRVHSVSVEKPSKKLQLPADHQLYGKPYLSPSGHMLAFLEREDTVITLYKIAVQDDVFRSPTPSLSLSCDTGYVWQECCFGKNFVCCLAKATTVDDDKCTSKLCFFSSEELNPDVRSIDVPLQYDIQRVSAGHHGDEIWIACIVSEKTRHMAFTIWAFQIRFQWEDSHLTLVLHDEDLYLRKVLEQNAENHEPLEIQFSQDSDYLLWAQGLRQSRRRTSCADVVLSSWPVSASDVSGNGISSLQIHNEHMNATEGNPITLLNNISKHVAVLLMYDCIIVVVDLTTAMLKTKTSPRSHEAVVAMIPGQDNKLWLIGQGSLTGHVQVSEPIAIEKTGTILWKKTSGDSSFVRFNDMKDQKGDACMLRSEGDRTTLLLADRRGRVEIVRLAGKR